MPPAHIYPQVADLPFVTTTQMIEVDRRMIEDIGISLFQMMENAGLQLANVARDVFLDGTAKDKRIAVLAGPVEMLAARSSPPGKNGFTPFDFSSAPVLCQLLAILSTDCVDDQNGKLN